MPPAPGPEDRKVFFFHVMKTGGVTFRRILTSIFGSSFQVVYDPSIGAVEQLVRTSDCIEFHSFQYRGALAHMHTGLLREHRLDLLAGQHCFTMLREPVDCAVSLYYFQVRRRHLIEPVYKTRGLQFPDSFEDYLNSFFHFNLQTAFLADCHQLGPETAVNGADVERARDLLVKVGMHVGLTERFSDSMNVFESVTGHVIPGHTIHNENTNPDRLPLSQISQKVKDRIRDQSGPDLALYKFGREMFLADLARCPPTRSYTFLSPTTDSGALIRSASSSGQRPADKGAGALADSSRMAGAEGDKAMATGARRAVFFHIMKTGGMTFRKVLSSIYGTKFHVVDDPSIAAIEAALAEFECIEFHTLPFAGDFVHMHAELARTRRWDVLAGTDVFTMLRQPVDQVVSQYFYMQTKRANIEPAYKANGIPFPETIDQYLDDPAHLNNQLAFLAGKYRLKAGGDVNHTDLQAVQQMMVELSVHPGLTERFSESLHIFETVTGRKVAGGEIVNQNQNADRLPLGAIPARVKDRIREMSALDLELYDFARDLFMSDVAACGPTRKYSFIGG